MSTQGPSRNDETKLPKYSDCEYSLFISYAHRDNTANNQWVKALKDAIYQRMDKLDRRIPKLPIHFSEESNLYNGQLGFKLADRVKRSFAMMLVVGTNYLTSGGVSDKNWCEEEVKLFSQFFGSEGYKSRLFVAVMSGDDLDNARKLSCWKSLIPLDQLYVPMFDPSSTDKYPYENTMLNGSSGFPGNFFGGVKKLADPLIEEIQNNFNAEPAQVQMENSTLSPETCSLWAVPSYQQPRIVIGPFTENLSEVAETLRAKLSETCATVSLISREEMALYDPEDGKPLRPTLNEADVLIVPISDVKPLRPEKPGGHTAILQEEWGRLSKRLNIIWYRPPEVNVTQENLAPKKHLDEFSQLGPVCQSPEAVLSLIFGQDSHSAFKIYVEEHDKAPVFKALANRFHETWKKLTAKGYNPNKLPLKFVPFRFNSLVTMPNERRKEKLKDLDGVVLMLPQGSKPNDSLYSQQSMMEKWVDKQWTTYPGCVALIYKEQDKFPSGEKWTMLEFLDAGQVPVLELDPDYTSHLDAWLIDLIYQRESTSLSLSPGSSISS